MKNERIVDSRIHEKKNAIAAAASLPFWIISTANPAFGIVGIGAIICTFEMMRQLHLHLKEHPEDRRDLNGNRVYL